MGDSPVCTVSLDGMITHDKLLGRYPWPSGRIVNRWRRQGAIRVFAGNEGTRVYAISDIVRAITADMDASIEKQPDEEPKALAQSPPVAKADQPLTETTLAERREIA